MRFLVDDQLPVALARWIAAQGVAAVHVSDVGLTGTPDRDIWSWASQMQAVIVSKDEDFVYLRQVEPSGPRLVWLRLGNTRNIVLFQKLGPIWPHVIAKLEAGDQLIEISG